MVMEDEDGSGDANESAGVLAAREDDGHTDVLESTSLSEMRTVRSDVDDPLIAFQQRTSRYFLIVVIRRGRDLRMSHYLPETCMIKAVNCVGARMMRIPLTEGPDQQYFCEKTKSGR